MTPRARRVGLLGGTFDPIHAGHLDVAEAARRALELDEVRLIPARVPPHRSAGALASADDRLAMVRLAIEGCAHLVASDLELRAPGPSYTSATLRELGRQGWRPTQLFFITGADAFAEIATWRDYPAVLDLAHFAVVSRPGLPVASLPDRLPALAARMVEARRRRRRADGRGRADRDFLDPRDHARRILDRDSRPCRGAGVARGAGAAAGRRLHPPARSVPRPHPRQTTCMAKSERARKRATSRKLLPALLRAVEAAHDKKASGVVALDLRKASAFTDYFLVCSGRNVRQVKAIADAIEESLRAKGQRPSLVEGYARAEWILMDFFDFVVHVFTPDTRRFYALERLWGNAERIEFPGPGEEPAASERPS